MGEGLTADEIDSLITKMKGSGGIVVKDRKWMLKTYTQCFVGKDAVTWLVNNKYVGNREDAVRVGNILLKAGRILHVLRDHDFKDANYFYRFFEPETAQDKDSTWANFIPGLLGDDPDIIQPSLPEKDDDMQYSLDELDVKPLDEHNIKLLDNVHPAKWIDPTPEGTYNMVVIGAGSGGLVSAIGAAGVGAKVAIIEKHLLGGDCLNVGCVPSKALIRAAHAVAHVRDSAAFGVKLEGAYSVDFAAIMERLRKLRADISPHDSAKRMRDDYGIDVFIGSGKFIGKDKVQVNNKILKFAKAVIATGGRAAIPPIKGLQDIHYLTNASVFNLTVLPKRLAVIGAGAIGCEMAQCFQRFGSQVSLFFRSPHIMRREDFDAVEIVEKALEKDGVKLFAGTKYISIEEEGGEDKEKEEEEEDSEGEEKFLIKALGGVKTIVIEHEGQRKKIQVDAILVSTGRKPNVEGLGLEAAGVKYDRRKGVVVSNTLQTTNGNIYAVGDVATEYQFTHVSDSMARMAIRNALFFGRMRMSSLIIPWATYTDPEIAHVGAYEKDLEAQGIKVAVYKREFDDVDRAILDSETEGFVKILCKEGSDQILGATIVASHAGDMISEVTTAMVGGIGLGTIASVIHPYPTQAEAIRQLGDEFNRTRLTTPVKILFRKLLQARR